MALWIILLHYIILYYINFNLTVTLKCQIIKNVTKGKEAGSRLYKFSMKTQMIIIVLLQLLSIIDYRKYTTTIT